MTVVTRRSVVSWTLAATAGGATLGVTGCSDRRTVVVTGQVDPSRAAAYRAVAVRGVERTRQLWGRDRVSLPVRLHLPRSVSQWAEATGNPASASGYAGSTVRRPGREPVVVLHPSAWQALTPEGRAGVVTHEIAHLAMGPDRAAPWWLTEGLAEYTAHRGADDRPGRIAGSALPRLRADPPDGWPRAPADASHSPWPRYAAAWLACVFLADEVGERALLQAYAATRAGSSWERACRSTLDRPASRLHRHWLRWLEDLDEPTTEAAATERQDGV